LAVNAPPFILYLVLFALALEIPHMKEGIRFCIKLIFTIVFCTSTIYSQMRQSAQRQPTSRPGAPFLQQVRAYEETTYVTRVVLKNGMTVLVNEFKAQPVVTIQVYVRAGSLTDPTQCPGMARLVAALIQRGPPDKTSGTFRQKIQALGGILRSTTDYGKTMFEVVAPSSQWKRALDAQTEAILNPSFNQDDIGLEWKLIQSEARGILDDPLEIGKEKLLELAFNRPRMGKYDTISSGSLANFTPGTVAGFYNAQYAPAGLMMIVSGDVGSSDVLNEVAKLYVKPASPAAKPARVSSAGFQDGFRYSAIRGKVSVPHLFLGFHAVPENNFDYRALEILRAVLGLGDGSVIQSRLRDQKKLILSSETSLTSDPEYFSIQAKVNPEKIDQSEIALLTEIELLKREELSVEDMERALAQLERSHWASLETVSGRARGFERFESAGDWKGLDRYVADLKKVKASDVKNVAAKYLRLGNCSLLEYLPASGEERQATTEGMRRTFESLVVSSADQEQAARNREIVLSVTIPPKASGFKFSEFRNPFQVASILRGPDLFIREDHTSPLIEMGLFFPGGKFQEKKENAGITELLLRMMLRGGTDVNLFYRQLEVYGGHVRPVITDDYFGFYFSILSQNFEPGFKLLLDTIQSPNFDPEEVKRQKEIQKTMIFSDKNSEEFAIELANRLLFGDFSYSLGRDGAEGSVSAITPESLKAWYEANVKNKKPLVTLIGDTQGTSLASIFVQRLSGSRFQQTKILEEFVKPLEKATTEEQNWDRSESLILVGFQAPPEDDEDRYPVTVLQGYAGDPGRLSQELRDRLGAAYEVSVAYEPRLRGGSLIIRAATDNGDALIKALREEIQRMTSSPITFRDFRAAISEAVGAYAIRQQVRSAQIADITENALAGKGIEEYRNFASGLQDVNDQDLKAVIQRVFNMDRTVILRISGKME
jgi:zinc protease